MIVEGDAKLVIDTIQKSSSPVDWPISTCVGDIHILTSYFRNCNSAWTCRDENNLAHTIAKFAASLSYFVCNFENIPQVLLNAWQLDVLCSSS